MVGTVTIPREIHDIGIDPASGNLFVGDYELDTIRVFGPTGELVQTAAPRRPCVERTARAHRAPTLGGAA